jgi:hypothetical protein
LIGMSPRLLLVNDDGIDSQSQITFPKGEFCCHES